MVTAFLRRGERVLLLRRSHLVGTFRGRWAGVSGSIPEGVSPLEQALREIREETGLGPGQVALERVGRPLLVVDEQGRRWEVHPFLFRLVGDPPIRLDWEHTEARWVHPGDIPRFPTVPGLPETWARLEESDG